MLTREDIRLSLIRQGCVQADLSVQSQKETVLSVCKLLNRAFKYTPDEELDTDDFLSIKRGHPEQWVSRHVELAERKFPIKGDCDDFTMTGLQCALILGVNPSRLAAVAVVDDLKIRKSIAVKPPINHLVGGFYDGQDWLACFDTYTQPDRTWPYLAKIGQGRKSSQNYRHSGQLIAIASEGLRWRAYPDSWFRFKN